MDGMHLVEPDVDAIRRDLTFFTARWRELEPDAILELRALGEGRQPKIGRFTVDRLEEAIEWATDLNAAGLNIYMVRNPIRPDLPPTQKGAEDRDIIGAIFLWADGDTEEAARNVLAFDNPRNTAAVVTGRVPFPRPHPYWALDEWITDMAAWTDLQRRIAAHLKTDRAVVNPSRIMRVGGTVSYPTKRKQSAGRVKEIAEVYTEYDPPRPRVTVAQMQAAFPPLPASPGATSATHGAFAIDTSPAITGRTGDDYAEILQRARTDGEKHGGVRDLTASLAGAGVPMAMARAIAQEACPVWDDNAEKLLTSAYSKYYTEPFTPEAPFASPAAPAMAPGPQVEPAAPIGELVRPISLDLESKPPRFPLDILPPVLRAYAEEQVAHKGATAPIAAMSALGAVVAAVDKRICVKVNEGGWKEHPVLWLMGVATASAKKTPIARDATKAVIRFEEEMGRENESAWSEYRLAHEIYKKRRTAYTSAMAKDAEVIPDRPIPPEKPPSRRMTVKDTTTEGLIKVLETNPHGVTLMADELTQWFGQMDAYSGNRNGGASKDRGIWLQAYNSDSYIVDRKGTETDAPSIYVENLAVAIVGFGQPSALLDAFKNLPHDGLLQRFAPFIGKASTLADDDAIDRQIASAFHSTIERICHLKVQNTEVQLSKDAAQLRRHWWSNEVWPIIESEMLSSPMTSHLAKIEGNVFRWALVLHVADCAARGVFPGSEDLSADTMWRAIRLHDEYLIPAILHLYEVVFGDDETGAKAREVANWILASGKESFTLRDLTRSGPRWLRKGVSDQEKYAILRWLEDAGWIASDPRDTRRPPRDWQVNPLTHSEFADQALREKARRNVIAEKLAQMRAEPREDT